MVKAQIHSGARGKAGGVRICSTEQEVSDAANWMLGRKLVTHQTGPQGKLVSRLYVEEATSIAQELYLAFVMDRKEERVVVVASAQGGMEIEEISEKEPDIHCPLGRRPGGWHAGLSGARNRVLAGP